MLYMCIYTRVIYTDYELLLLHIIYEFVLKKCENFQLFKIYPEVQTLRINVEDFIMDFKSTPSSRSGL